MNSHADILEQRESLGGPFLQSILLHAAVAGLLVLSTINYTRSHEVWGSATTSLGDAVEVNAVKSIPLPSHRGLVNPVANDTESIVPQAPKPQPKPKAQPPEPKAIPLKSRHVDTRSLEQMSPQRYQPRTPPANQILSSQAPATVSPMYQKPGSGGVGVGPNSTFGNRFGAYADIVIKRVSEKWLTGGMAGIQTAPLAVVTFDILRDGSVRNAKVAQSSGNTTLDFSALRAVMDAAPFPTLPAEYDRNVANVELRFQLQR